MKAYKRLLSGVLTVVLLLSGCGATVTAGLFKSKIGFIGETGKNNMKLYDEFKDWERQVSAPVAVVDEGIYLKRKGEVQQLSCGKMILYGNPRSRRYTTVESITSRRARLS